MQKRFSKLLICFLAVIILTCSFCIFASAADEYKNCKGAYGSIIPTDKDLSAQKSSYSFNGDYGVFYFMRMSEGKKDAWFTVEIYSDSNYVNQARSFKSEYSETPGRKPLSVKWNFTDDISSGVYYGKCYSYYLSGEDKVIDTSTIETFKININRVGNRVVSLKSLSNTTTGPKITWETVPTATKYYVYRRAEGETKWTRIATLGESATSHTDKTAKSGTKYTYTVKCSDGKNTSLYEKKGLTTYYIATPKLSPVTGVYSTGAAKISWTKSAGATGYYVYRKGGSLSEYSWKKIATIKNVNTTSYVDKTAKNSDWCYTYTVRAYYGNYKSSYYNSGVDFNYLAAPKITKVGPQATGMQITWTSNDTDITHFYVYRKEGSSWKRIGTTTQKSFIDTKAASNKKYTYTVKAKCDTNVGAYNSKGVSAKFMATPKLQPLTFNSSYNSVVKWSKVTGASGYEVYRKVNNAKSWTKVATIKKGSTTTYYDKAKKSSGARYTYTVRSFDSNNVRSWFTPEGTTGIILAKPKFTVAQAQTADNSLAINVSWAHVNGATKYNVYRRVPGGTWAHLMDDVTDLFFIDTTAESGVTYQYAVRARNDVGSISAYYINDATAVSIPTMLEASVEETGISLKWSAVENATYNIYRASVDSEEWTLIGTSETDTFIDEADGFNTTAYKYCVEAIVNGFSSVKSNAITNVTEITATAEYDKETDAIVLTWDSALAEFINITKTCGEEEPVDLGVFSASLYTSYSDTVIEPGKEYTYTITAQSANKINGTATVTAKCPLPPLEKANYTSVTASYNDGDPICTLQWSSVEFASEYRVLRSANGVEYTDVATVKAEDAVEGTLTYVDYITEETSYKYIVKAISQEDREPSHSAPTEKITVYKPLDAVRDLVAESAINHEGVENAIFVTLTWAPTENAEYYTIQRKTADSENYEFLTELPAGDNTETTYTDETAFAGVQYTYKVTARSVLRGSVNNTVDFFRAIEE